MNNPNPHVAHCVAGLCAVTITCVFAACDDAGKAATVRYRKPVSPVRKQSIPASGGLDRLRGALPAGGAVAAVTELIGSPLLKDPAAPELVASHFRDCPPELLAEVLRQWPYESNTKAAFVHYLKTFLTELPDVEMIGKYIKPLPLDRDRGEILQYVVQHSPLLTPQTLGGFLRISEAEEDRDQIGRGLASRLSAMPSETRMAAAQEYLDLNPPVEIARAVVEIAMYDFAKGDPERITEWLLSQSGDVAGGADLVLIGKLGSAAETRNVAVSFIQQLIDSGQAQRAGCAVEALATSFSFASPPEAMSWVLQLPDSLGNSKVKAAKGAYLMLRDRDPQLADQLVSGETNPDFLRAVQTYRDEAAKEAAASKSR
jgi:hypothetical protein